MRATFGRSGCRGATDNDVLACAYREQRVLITTDTDIGTILALSGADGPSVLLLRRIGDTIRRTLTRDPVVEDELLNGAVAVVERDRVRLRRLPVDEA